MGKFSGKFGVENFKRRGKFEKIDVGREFGVMKLIKEG